MLAAGTWNLEPWSLLQPEAMTAASTDMRLHFLGLSRTQKHLDSSNRTKISLPPDPLQRNVHRTLTDGQAELLEKVLILVLALVLMLVLMVWWFDDSNSPLLFSPLPLFKVITTFTLCGSLPVPHISL